MGESNSIKPTSPDLEQVPFTHVFTLLSHPTGLVMSLNAFKLKLGCTETRRYKETKLGLAEGLADFQYSYERIVRTYRNI